MLKSVTVCSVLLGWCGLAVSQLDPSIPLQARPMNIEPIGVAMQRAAAINAARAQAELLAAQTRLLEQQARENERRSSAPAPTSSPVAGQGQPHPIFQEWLRVAGPRIHHYPDFQTVVFSQEVTITEDMIRLMSGSPLAADIAYYLGKNRLESKIIAQMTLLDAARAVDRIERTVRATAPP